MAASTPTHLAGADVDLEAGSGALASLPAVAFVGRTNLSSLQSTSRTRDRLASVWSATKKRIGQGNGLFRDSDLSGEPTETETDSGSVHRAQCKVRRVSGGNGAGTAFQNEKGQDKEDLSMLRTATINSRVVPDDVSTLVDTVVVENDGIFKTLGGADQDDHPSLLGADLHAGGLTLYAGAGTGSARGTGPDGTRRSETSSINKDNYIIGGPFIRFCRWRIWPNVTEFFMPQFSSPELEMAYQKESWFTAKRACLWACVFFELNFILTVALLPRPWSTWNIVSNAGISPIVTIPLIPMAMWDFPSLHRPSKTRFWIWQVFVFFAVLIVSTTSLIDMKLCNYYAPRLSERHCGARDFISVLFYACAPSTVALFALGQTRLFALGIFVIWFGLVSGTILPMEGGFIRSAINLLIFYVFLLVYAHQREVTQRCTFTLRSELKVQWKAKQRAEHRERREADASKRFSNYIFHEVRVPLNTALLAVQNLHASGAIDNDSDQAVEFQALDFSLATMSTVLNDVLDFSRMEKGGFSSIARPFHFHRALHGIFTQLRLDIDARGLKLETHLDPRIDEIALKAALPSSEWPDQIIEGDGLVMGDEMRVRQVITNLTSNACKFTPSGGSVTVVTKLLYPEGDFDRPATENGDTTILTDSIHSDETTLVGSGSVGVMTPPLGSKNAGQGLTMKQLEKHDNVGQSKPACCPGEVIVVRIEVRDTGVGIRPRDTLHLFSAYVQTEIGKKQGGKGTGLGLSLVRQIVKLSGGRLGVSSKLGEGSTFWVELPFQVGPLTLKEEADPLDLHRSNSLNNSKCTPVEFPPPAATPSSFSDSSGSYRFMYTPPSIQGRSMAEFLSKIEERETLAVEMSEKKDVLSILPSTPSISSPLASPPISSPPMSSPISITSSSASTAVNSPSIASSSLSAPTVLARATSSTSSTRSAPPRPLEFEDGPVRVLVVDDDALTRKLMTRLLERAGCLVSSAVDGEQALEMILAVTEGDPPGVHVYHYDIVLLDNQMPKKTGLEVASTLRSLSRRDFIVGVTANAMRHDQEEYISRGANHVLTKPVAEIDLRRYCTLADQHRTTRKSLPPTPILPRPPLTHFPKSRDSSSSFR